MNSSNAIQKELAELGSSLPINDYEQPVFTVPEGYFENFAASVMAQLKNQPAETVQQELGVVSPLLAAIPKINPYHVPENYFDSLASDLPAFANTHDEALPGLLATHTKQMPYTVPGDYFDSLATQVKAKLPAPQAKVVSFNQRFMRYAAAAVLAAVLAMGGWLYLAPKSSTPDPAKQPAAWIAQKLANVPNRDLDAFLKTADTGFTSKALAQKSGSEVQQLLRDVPTKELDAFLNDVPLEAESANVN